MKIASTLAFLAVSAVSLGGCGGGDDAGAEECSESVCSADGTRLTECAKGRERQVDCLGERGQLCEAGACVDPWRWGSPVWSTCEGEARGTKETLAEKAVRYDEIATRLHLHPDLGWIMTVTLPGAPRPCATGESPPCVEPTVPAVSEADATWADVETWHSGENDGLWNALYLASQAFRWAATRSPEALDAVRRLLEGQQDRMRITGVPGIYTRQYIPPGVPGIACPTDDAAYVPDVEKNDNQWVQVREDGCVWTVARATGAWTRSDHCGLDDYAGWCWLENVSKDEYSGHLFALGAVYRLVDDEGVRAIAVDHLEQIADHLRENALTLVDWDGRVTEHGKFSPLAFDDYPGFNAAMAMDFVLMAVEATGREDLRRWFDDCLLMRSGIQDCIGGLFAINEPFPAFLPDAGMYVGDRSCGQNFNNISMHMLSMHNLIWFARDRELRTAVQRSLDVDVVRAEKPRRILDQRNAWIDFMWAAQKHLGPDSDGPAYDAVEDGICMLKQFRASQTTPDVALPAGAVPYCKDRFGRDAAEHPREIADRCPGTFVWWGDPYGLGTCTANTRTVHQPTGYLLPYWMGRYYGFIPEDL